MSFIKNVGWIFSGRVLSFIIGIGSSIIIARGLGPTGKGELALLMLIPTTLFMLIHFGVSKANIYFLNQKKISLQSISNANLFLFLILSAVSILIYAVVVAFLRHNLLQQIEMSLIVLAVIFLPLQFFNSYFSSFLQAYQWMKENSIIGVLSTILNLPLLILGIYILHLSILGALLASIISSFFGCLLVLWYVKKLSVHNSKADPYKNNFTLREKLANEKQINLIKSLITFSSRIYISGMMWFFILRADMYMVSYFLGITDLGYYSLSVGIAENLWLIPGAVATVLLPTVSSLKQKESGEFIAKVIRITMWLMIILCIVLIIFAKPIIIILFSQKFIPSITPFRLLVIAAVAFAVRNLLADTFVGWGRPEINIYTRGIALGVNVVANLYFIPHWGIVGAAFTSLMAYTIDVLLSIVIFLRISNVGLFELLLLKREDIQLVDNLKTHILQKLRR